MDDINDIMNNFLYGSVDISSPLLQTVCSKHRHFKKVLDIMDHVFQHRRWNQGARDTCPENL